MKLSILLIVILAITQGCGKKSNDRDANVDSMNIDANEVVIESGLSVISGSLDEQSNSSFAFRSEKVNSIWATLLLDKAYAASCSRAFLQACNSGVKEIEYSDCSTPSELREMTGSVKLTYSNSSCTLNTVGESVIRTYNTQIIGPRGGTVTNSSDSGQDYRLGNAYGGGAKILKTATGHTLEVMGKHKTLEINGRELFNISIKTLQTLEVTGGLTRGARKVSNGQLEINHNLAKFSTVMTAKDLQWSSSCCHPVSGSLSLSRSGSKTGSATVTFSADECGVASLEENGQTSKIELSYCE